MDLPRPFFKFHDRVINIQAISDIQIQSEDKLLIRMLAPDSSFVVEGIEAKTLLNLLRELWVDSHA
jgi:hypothetical protein